MKKCDLLDTLLNVPNDADIVIGKCFVVDEKDALTGILDIPIVGTAYDDKNNELRFVLSLDDVKKCFHPKDMKFLE
jgi:hypothetical protein